MRLFQKKKGSSNLKKKNPTHCLAPPEHLVNRASKKENLRVKNKRQKKTTLNTSIFFLRKINLTALLRLRAL
jgi:hypothetical protein